VYEAEIKLVPPPALLEKFPERKKYIRYNHSEHKHVISVAIIVAAGRLFIFQCTLRART